MSKIKKRVYEIVAEPPEGDWLGNFVNVAILTLIAVNVTVGVFETIGSLHAKYKAFFYYFELVSVIIFTIEYVLRIWSCTVVPQYQGWFFGRLRLARTPMAMIDLAAILPFYLAAFMTVDLRFVRVLRLFRLFRLFRAGKLAQSFGILVAVIQSKKQELALSGIVLALVLVLSSSVMFLVEQNEPKTQFTSVPATMWWGVMTITTIGYGDIYPTTPLGRVIGSFVGFLGICVFALPVGMLGSGFVEYMEQKRKAKEKAEAEEAAARAPPAKHDPKGGLPYCPSCGYHLHGETHATPEA